MNKIKPPRALHTYQLVLTLEVLRVEVTITPTLDLELLFVKNEMFSSHLAADGKQIQIMKI